MSIYSDWDNLKIWQKVSYVYGILRNRFDLYDEDSRKDLVNKIRAAVNSGHDIDVIRSVAKQVDDEDEFSRLICREDLLEHCVRNGWYICEGWKQIVRGVWVIERPDGTRSVVVRLDHSKYGQYVTYGRNLDIDWFQKWGYADSLELAKKIG